jgi:hypothetical protein
METNAELFENGIQTENSDIRAHVSVVNKAIYVFPTFRGREAVEANNIPIKTAIQPGLEFITASGWPVPIEYITDLRAFSYASWPLWSQFRESMNTSAKGKLAVECVLSFLKTGRFPFWIHAQEDDRENIQISGTDIVIFCRKKLQIKCDWRCGHKPLGTGNLFLQKAERNPLRRY